MLDKRYFRSAYSLVNDIDDKFIHLYTENFNTYLELVVMDRIDNLEKALQYLIDNEKEDLKKEVTNLKEVREIIKAMIHTNRWVDRVDFIHELYELTRK
ncbi:MAG: hypothetical protein ACRC92_21525 [Peptostreptococcaceae bacterium]